MFIRLSQNTEKLLEILKDANQSLSDMKSFLERNAYNNSINQKNI